MVRLRGRGRAGRRRGVAAAVAGTLLVAACGAGGSEGDGRPSAAQAVPDVECAASGKVRGSGSSAQQNAMKRWIQQYQRACAGVEVAYNPLGSGAGVAQFQRGATAFGGTDEALSRQDVEESKGVCDGGRAIDLPMAGGPIAIGHNVPGVSGLVLDAPTLARLFDARITRWNHPSIQRLNPGTTLPDLPVVPVHRADDSGTTQNFTAYLKAAARTSWPYPAGKKWQARGGQSGTGSDGVAGTVAQTEGAIGYFELSFAVKRGIDTVRVATGASEPVAPSTRSASAGIAEAEVAGEGGDLALDLDYRTSAEGAYPIVLVTYEIVCDRGNDPETLPALKSFLSYTAGEDGQRLLPSIHHAPLPDSVAAQVREVVGTLS